MGIDSNRVVCAERVPPETFCPVCDDLIDPVDAVQTCVYYHSLPPSRAGLSWRSHCPERAVPCGHLFCGPCIEGVVQVHGQCPQDRQALTLQQLQHAKECNPFVYRLLGRAILKCIHHEDGCPWTGEVSESASHTLTCGKETITCPRCRLRMLREALTGHQQICHDCKDCKDKDAELDSLRHEVANVQHLAAKASGLALQLRTLQAQQQGEREHDFSYDRCTAVEAAVLVAENIGGHHPRHADRSKLFAAVKWVQRLAEAWSHPAGDPNRPSDSDLHFLLTACAASALFAEAQRKAICHWTVKVCLRVIDVEAM